MKTILITGSNGLLGQKLIENVLQSKAFNLIATSKGANRFPIQGGYQYAEMDILDADNVRDVILKYHPDAIINTAAMTNVDACEREKELCTKLNVDAVKTLVSLCEQYDIHLVHLSTDFIFDGAAGPYAEDAEPNPLSYYGLSKLKAEQVLQQSKAKYAILRTIIVYGIVSDMSRNNIVLWAKEALEKGQAIEVVNDQWRMPTLAEDLAQCCLFAVEKQAQGVFNASGKDLMSIAELVTRVADYWKLDKSLIKEISATTLNQLAKRPVRTGFDLTKSIQQLNYQPHSFEEGLAILDKQLTNRLLTLN